jgi:glutaminyl-peptide cyclotransferase
MKKYLILGVLILFIITMVVVPRMKGSETEDLKPPAEFAFKNNLTSRWKEVVPIEIVVDAEDVVRIDLVYNDSIFHTWKNPSGKIKYLFEAGYYGIGARSMSLISTLRNGTVRMDNRSVKVLSDITPESWFAKVVESYPHFTSSYTQGLEFSNGMLYESTGQYGYSGVAQVDLNSGINHPAKNVRLDRNYFGEGITVLEDQIYQITWKEQKCFVYDKNSFQLLREISYHGEGWGLCNDGRSLIMSDGTERITFRNPETFAIEKTLEVYNHLGPLRNINELEYIDGKIYANIWQTNKVIVLDPVNGKVMAVIDGSEIERAGKGTGEVMNGIAYNALTQKTYFTGKNWEKVIEVRIEKR